MQVYSGSYTLDAAAVGSAAAIDSEEPLPYSWMQLESSLALEEDPETQLATEVYYVPIDSWLEVERSCSEVGYSCSQDRPAGSSSDVAPQVATSLELVTSLMAGET